MLTMRSSRGSASELCASTEAAMARSVAERFPALACAPADADASARAVVTSSRRVENDRELERRSGLGMALNLQVLSWRRTLVTVIVVAPIVRASGAQMARPTHISTVP